MEREMTEDNKPMSEIIPEKDFREAITACRKDPELNRYFKFAPPAARRFIGLGFYSTYFGDKADKQHYAEYLKRLEPTLNESDLKYLIRFEPDKATRQYLKDLLAHPKPSPKPEVKAERKAEPKKAKPAAGTPRKPKPLPLMREEEPQGESLGPVKIVVFAAVALLGLISLCFNIKFAHDLSVKDEALTELNEEVEGLKRRMEKMGREAARPVPSPAVVERKTVMPASDPVESETVAAPEPETREEMKEPEREVSTNDVPAVEGKAVKPDRIVRFTDGSRIVRKPGGVIEVPRTFSYAGAGLKRPFWQYDGDLERSGKIEQEAERERKARAEWQALRDEAARQDK